MIIEETPAIKDIDIFRDVRKLLSEIYESIPVDPWQQGQAYNIFTVWSYCEYVKFRHPTKTWFREAYRTVKEMFGKVQTLSQEDESQIRSLVTDVVQQTDKMIQSFNISKMGYSIICIQQIIDYIWRRVKQHENGPVKYVFKKEFFTDLVLAICKRANCMITDQQTMFRKANDPVFYLEKKRYEYYSIFQKYCHGPTSAAILGEILCQKLKEPIKQSVYKRTARDLADEMRTNCESLNGNRSKLEKHILRTLAEKEDFNKYMNYIDNPKDHCKSFIRDEVSQYVPDNFNVNVLLKVKEYIKLLQQKIMEAAHKSTKHILAIGEDVGLWLKHFTNQLSDVLIFSEKDLSGVKHDDVDEFELLEDAINKELTVILSDICSTFNPKSFLAELDYKDRPDEILIDHFSQCCWVQCPFCRATCTKTIENHGGEHSVPFHRSIGLSGIHYDKTSNLSTHICTSAVANSNLYFYPIGSEDKVPWTAYRRAGGEYAKWSIIPDLSELPYWKWFVCRFQKDVEKCYNKTFRGRGEIPDEWRKYTKQDAFESLEKYF
ncbi:Interferon-induced very large GTPase 1 [Labeo rohita]|uniref:Interferon-induced very large GTPase 1 n=1 Tax=Labeo rohita TaxID=84645 RepID=A0ABQ8LC98_LABRO|nr:Interferon-induced very large GTPase 1 [Labeo rohita]